MDTMPSNPLRNVSTPIASSEQRSTQEPGTVAHRRASGGRASGGNAEQAVVCAVPQHQAEVERKAIPAGGANAVTPPTNAELVRRALESAGCRYTTQRAAVFDYLESVDSHPTAEEVYQAVRAQLPKISLATVYKALEALVEARLATKLTNGDGSARYDCRAEDHYHLRDVATGEIHDLPVQYDRELLAKIDPQLVEKLLSAGFEVTGYRLEVLGRFADASRRA